MRWGSLPKLVTCVGTNLGKGGISRDCSACQLQLRADTLARATSAPEPPLAKPCIGRHVSHPSNRETLMTAVALGLHIFGAVVWVGGMFAIYVCLRPAL